MSNFKLWLADLDRVLTPQLKPTGGLKTRQKLPINPALTSDHAPDGSVTNPGLRAEVAHRRDCPLALQHLKHVLDISGHLDGASKYGIICVHFTKSRPLTTPREIAGASAWGSSGHAHQSKAVR